MAQRLARVFEGLSSADFRGIREAWVARLGGIERLGLRGLIVEAEE